MDKKYGYKAYGKTVYFGTEEEYMAFLLDWMAGTEGAERERANAALTNLLGGVPFTDTDK